MLVISSAGRKRLSTIARVLLSELHLYAHIAACHMPRPMLELWLQWGQRRFGFYFLFFVAKAIKKRKNK